MPFTTRALNTRLLALLLSSTVCTLLYTGCKEDATSSTHTDVCTHWEYSGDAGPEHWKDCATNTACGGQVQSPINITGATDDISLDDIEIAHDSSKTAILNNGHTLQWNYDSTSNITFNGVLYRLLQFHFHTPSEHTVDGKSFAMEVHLVHKDLATGNLAVIGVLFNEGAENPLLQEFINNLPAVKDSTFNSTMKFIASDLLPTSMSYYTYAGSLTTPPCSEIVTWIVMKNPIEASKAQIDKIESIVHINNRPVQALAGRAIKSHG